MPESLLIASMDRLCGLLKAESMGLYDSCHDRAQKTDDCQVAIT